MVINQYLPIIGGAERVLANVCPYLHAEGVEPYIVTRRYGDLKPYEELEGVPVYRLPIPGPKAVASLAFTLAALPLLRHLNPHVYHAHHLFSATTTGVLAKLLFHRPVVVTPHRGGMLGEVRRVQHAFMGPPRLALFRRKVDLFFAISSEIDHELDVLGVPSYRRAFVPNGIDPHRFVPTAPSQKPALRARLGISGGPVVLFSGRLAPEKRVDQLIRLWPTVRRAHPDALLLILGTGSEEETLKRMAAEVGTGIQFAGRVDDVVPYLQASDVFVLPSVAEGLSIAVLEALAVGMAVVVSDVGGNSDIITHGTHGLLIPADDEDTLADALVGVLGDEKERERLGRNGRERVEETYTLQVMARRLRESYERVMM
jgi:glycosyltransferase involved in cell wall biosynthesis